MLDIPALLEQIVQDTVNAKNETPSDEEMEDFAQVPAEQFVQHAIDYIDRWLDSYSQENKGLSFEALMGLYMSGFITGRIYEERRHATTQTRERNGKILQ